MQAHDPTVQWMTPPTRVSESTSDGVVAWFGPLTFRSSTLCEVELVSGVTPDYRLTQMSVVVVVVVVVAVAVAEEAEEAVVRQLGMSGLC